ncbi:Puromycin N-acetyltransferase-like protein [Emericellopsis cladophorae]|uniref:Puromycin N-acetyltransferase-like protein n=1 Tax=Emericellopsis cladophorae TaxID=2686198 RepID=A0A9Q0BBM7_9HYPO|nr:Puromycin N-acetyltransferase-like protein [Emericellopsis cladophorae]KAI6779957.1 Puromycin N-acetyltransferase-like protein [Emericellopsis cladophorae]
MSSIRPATEADIPALLAVFASAFSTSVFNATCFPDSDPLSHQTNRASIAADLVHTTLLERVSPDGVTREVLGWMSWKRRDTTTRHVVRAERFPPSGDPELARRFFQANVDAALRHMQPPYFHLSIIVVRRDAQGLGVGEQLMRHGLARVDAEGLPSYVNASRAGKGLYARHGFQTVEETHLGEHIAIWHMKRDATRK